MGKTVPIYCVTLEFEIAVKIIAELDFKDTERIPVLAKASVKTQ